MGCPARGVSTIQVISLLLGVIIYIILNYYSLKLLSPLQLLSKVGLIAIKPAVRIYTCTENTSEFYILRYVAKCTSDCVLHVFSWVDETEN